MEHADNPIPEFKTYLEGESIPPVDPEDIKRLRPRVRIEGEGWSWNQDMKAKLSPGADYTAVSSRCDMIATMYIYKLLAPWQRGEGFDDAVFRVAATLPLREVKRHDYMVSRDEQFGFDPNAFAQRLVEETGVSFVWEPVATIVPEGARVFSFTSIDSYGPERKAKRQTREMVWMIWKRFSPLFSHSDAMIDDFLKGIDLDYIKAAGNQPHGMLLPARHARRIEDTLPVFVRSAGSADPDGTRVGHPSV